MRSDAEPVVVPFAAIIPLREPCWLWALYLRAVFLVRFVPGRFFPGVHRLGTVLAMRWTLVPPFARDERAGRPPDRQYHLMFESNFGGDAFDYIENFARIIKAGMRLVFRPVLGYPGLEDPAAFTRFALSYDVPPELYHCAYPNADAVRVQQALLVSRTGSRDAERGAPEFHSPLPLPLTRRGQRQSPQWATIVLRVRAERAAALRARLDEVRTGLGDHEGYPFKNLTRTHFARMMVLDTPSGPYLMITMTFDALRRFRPTTAPIERRFALRMRHAEIAVAELVTENVDALDHILDHCEGYTSFEVPSSRRESSMLGYLLANRKDRGLGRHLPYCAYPRATVSEIKRALAWADRAG